MRWEVSGCTAAFFVGSNFQLLFKIAVLYNFHIAFYPRVSVEPKWCNPDSLEESFLYFINL